MLSIHLRLGLPSGQFPFRFITKNTWAFRRMASSGMLRRVALVRTDVSEELSASVIRVTRIAELGTLALKDGVFWDVPPCGS
jgi:hypothetical protein